MSALDSSNASPKKRSPARRRDARTAAERPFDHVEVSESMVRALERATPSKETERLMVQILW